MSIVLVSIAIVVAIIILGVVFAISRDIERRNTLKAQQIADLRRQVGQNRSFLDYIPLAYLSLPVARYFQQQALDALEQLRPLEPDNPRLAKELAAASEALTNLSADTRPPPHNLKSAEEANEIRRSLTSLFKYLQNELQVGHLDAPTAKTLLVPIRVSLIQIGAEVMALRAQDAKREGRAEIAIMFWERAIAELKKAGNLPQFAPLVEQCQRNLAEMQGGKPASPPPTPAAEAAAKQPAPGQSKLEKEMEGLIREDEAWKKKY